MRGSNVFEEFIYKIYSNANIEKICKNQSEIGAVSIGHFKLNNPKHYPGNTCQKQHKKVIPHELRDKLLFPHYSELW